MTNFTIAKYIRLSIEDEKTESLSIENQRLLLDRHIDEMDIPNAQVLEFCDNGHSGVNMERPAVQELLDLVRSGGVQLLIIKDFSRFSRNAMDSGYFVDQVFPLYGVRLISVSDGFDSADYKGNTGGIDVSFKFLMHEYYSQDLSHKVKSAKRLQMKRGENIVARCVYGYAKINGKWEPDGVASEVVRQIYDYALDGFTPAQIRDKLCADKIPTPQEYLEISRGKDVTPTFLWEARAVTRMLTNEQYKGTYVSGKQESKSVGSSSKDWNPKSEWIVFPHHHTPIIVPEVFDRVQEIMKRFLTSEKSPKTSKYTVAEHPKHDWIIRLPYGYRKNKFGEWGIDEVSSEVVRKIFELAQKGVYESEIATILTAEGQPNPSDYKQICLHKPPKPPKSQGAWRTKAVRDILRDIQYTGTRVSGKFFFDENGDKHRAHESDWIISHDEFPAIISKEDFDVIADIMANRGKRRLGQIDYLLRGNIVKCACCGYAMSYDKLSEPVYRCYHTIADASSKCHKLKISAAKLDKAVLTVIRKRAELVLKTADLSKLRRKSIDERKISDVETEIAENATERQRQYERFVLGEITRDEYTELKADCAVRLERLNKQLAAMKSEIDANKIDPRAIAVAKSALSEADNHRELVEALIETVKVYPNNRVDINWKIAGFGSAE
ncbi:hypothetical protein FACS189490_05160 [Clostridia bacterium]|nr:hypothetical protein FACS189490_05160 [Clostridia bacterium]